MYILTTYRDITHLFVLKSAHFEIFVFADKFKTLQKKEKQQKIMLSYTVLYRVITLCITLREKEFRITQSIVKPRVIAHRSRIIE